MICSADLNVVWDWESSRSHILMNSYLPEEERVLLQKALPLSGSFKSHFWLATSGTSGNGSSKTWVALGKEALMVSANAVNDHFKIDPKDVWFHALPSFHVGGLGIWCRAYLSGSKVVPLNGRWSASLFVEECKAHKATLSALVPTQLFDLIEENQKAPPSLRAVIIGGAALDNALYRKAQTLGWPIFPSYGLSECSSQVATTPLKSPTEPYLQVLDHVQVKIGSDHAIMLKSPSLLSAYGYVSKESCEIIDPKIEGWFRTQDRGELFDGEFLRYLGRESDLVKVSGEFVDLAQLDQILSNLTQGMDAVLFAKNDERLGSAIHLAVACKKGAKVDALVDAFNCLVLPFERIRGVHYLDAIPRNSLGKILRKQLASLEFV
jgi:O-succinylbenzoic acid--CoA ligase